jgi:hypothetical protein
MTCRKLLELTPNEAQARLADIHAKEEDPTREILPKIKRTGKEPVSFILRANCLTQRSFMMRLSLTRELKALLCILFHNSISELCSVDVADVVSIICFYQAASVVLRCGRHRRRNIARFIF